MPILVETGSVFLEKNNLKFVDVFLQFHNYLPLEKGGALHLNKIKSPLQKVDIGCVFLDMNIFKNLSMYFRNFLIISPWKGMGPFI